MDIIDPTRLPENVRLRLMPTVGKKKFPYTKKGKAAAKNAAMEKKHKSMMGKKPKMMM